MSVAEEFVHYALAIGAIELVPEGRKLKSGRISPYFFNSGLFNTGQTLLKLAQAYISTESIPLHSNTIFGLAYKGIPLATLISAIIWRECEVNIGFAFNRKENKDHGEKGIIVGHSLAGKNVCVVDDVITTGSSSGEAVKIIQANGGTPIACAIAFDRQECGIDTELSAVQKFVSDYKIPVFSVANLQDLIKVLMKDAQSYRPTIPNCEDALKKILLYRDKYGIDA